MVIRFGDFEFGKARRRLTRKGHPVRLTGQALDLLDLLAGRPGEVVTREEIRSALWPGSSHDLEHSLDVLVNRLRRILGDSGNNPEIIETVPRRGFRFLPPVVVEKNPYSDPGVPVNHPLRADLPPRTLRLAHAALRRAAPYVIVALVAALAAIIFARTRYQKFVPVQQPAASASPIPNSRR